VEKNMKVLIVDDEDDLRKIAALSLGRVGGMEVVEATSGSEAVEKAVREKPDVILLDVMMPGVDGPSTLGLLRSLPEVAAIPIIFLTAKAMPREVERLVSLGAKGVITKPFDPMSLAHQVRALLGAG
jgi:two-component system OmpR family response regulator